MLQAPPENLNHFEVLGLEPSPVVDEALLREKFLELSKKLHPDRYTSKGGTEAVYATRWSSLVNKAYQTLREPSDCAKYLLELNQVPTPKNTPVDLAEAYFELQEAGDKRQLQGFFKFLEGEIAQCALQRNHIAERWKFGADKPSLLKILAESMNRENYLRSMKNDLEQKLEKLA